MSYLRDGVALTLLPLTASIANKSSLYSLWKNRGSKLMACISYKEQRMFRANISGTSVPLPKYFFDYQFYSFQVHHCMDSVY